jgi:hypothetical protein
MTDDTVTDYSRDFVKLPRAVLRLLLPNTNALGVYLVTLDRARYVAGPSLFAGGLILEIGECVIGREELAIAIGITPAQVRTALAMLERLQILAIKTTKRGTIVKLVGYGENDDEATTESPTESPTDSQPIANRSPTDRQPVATNKKLRRLEDKTSKKSKKKKLAGGVVSLSPDGWKPPAGGKADKIAEARKAAGEISQRDVELCWEAAVVAGVHKKKAADAIAASWITNQRPEGSPSKSNGRVEPDTDAAYGGAPPWEL